MRTVSTPGVIKVNMKWEQKESSENCQEPTCPWHSYFMVMTNGEKEQFIHFSFSKQKSVCVSRTLCKLWFQNVEINGKAKKCPRLRAYVSPMLRKMHWDFILIPFPIKILIDPHSLYRAQLAPAHLLPSRVAGVWDRALGSAEFRLRSEVSHPAALPTTFATSLPSKRGLALGPNRFFFRSLSLPKCLHPGCRCFPHSCNTLPIRASCLGRAPLEMGWWLVVTW